MKILEWMSVKDSRNIYYFNSDRNFKAEDFAGRLYRMIEEEKARQGKKGVVFLCIGTDRSTGDSLGPLIGYKLRSMEISRASVFGTLERPVHAMNLEGYARVIKNCYHDCLVVAVDASVGNREHVGYLTLGKGALRPGLGVSKELGAVGDIFITGIVGGCSGYDPLMLQSVRLSVVMRMADCISRSIELVYKEAYAPDYTDDKNCRKILG
ncbi:MAG: spore protease YyaC [Clostridium sp.]|nr:spore protease YyaC [Clostridium sp.]